MFYLVSPLDTANMTEVELSEEQEDFLNWLKSSDVRHVRVVGMNGSQTPDRRDDRPIRLTGDLRDDREIGLTSGLR